MCHLRAWILPVVLVAFESRSLADSPFVRGDTNGDRAVDITDAIVLMQYLFGSREVPCLEALDVDEDAFGSLNVADAISLLDFLY